MGKSTISMAIFNSYASLPEGNMIQVYNWTKKNKLDQANGELRQICHIPILINHNYSVVNMQTTIENGHG